MWDNAVTLVNAARDLVRSDAASALERYRAAVRMLDSTASADPRSIAEAEAFVEAAFVQPSQRLVIYGTLAPGESNHHLLAGVGGSWFRGTVRGRRGTHDGYPTLRAAAGAASVEVLVLCSSALPDLYRRRLDDFEGPLWPRHLIVVDAPELDAKVASVYEFIG